MNGLTLNSYILSGKTGFQKGAIAPITKSANMWSQKNGPSQRWVDKLDRFPPWNQPWLVDDRWYTSHRPHFPCFFQEDNIGHDFKILAIDGATALALAKALSQVVSQQQTSKDTDLPLLLHTFPELI